VLVWRGSPDGALIFTGYLGYWLWAGTILAIGVLTSAVTQYQLVAFMIGEGIALFLFLAGTVGSLVNNTFVSTVLTQLTVTQHYQNSMLDRGLISAVDIAYFVGLSAIALFLATQTLNMRRWRA
jgi:ABC-2 type transport system permease protein